MEEFPDFPEEQNFNNQSDDQSDDQSDHPIDIQQEEEYEMDSDYEFDDEEADDNYEVVDDEVIFEQGYSKDEYLEEGTIGVSGGPVESGIDDISSVKKYFIVSLKGLGVNKEQTDKIINILKDSDILDTKNPIYIGHVLKLLSTGTSNVAVYAKSNNLRLDVFIRYYKWVLKSNISGYY